MMSSLTKSIAEKVKKCSQDARGPCTTVSRFTVGILQGQEYVYIYIIFIIYMFDMDLV